MTTTWLYPAPFVAASLHIVEEFFYPGGFPEWDRRYRPGFRQTITPRFHVVVNGLLWSPVTTSSPCDRVRWDPGSGWW